uniref:Uncharacterized protein n=1 Tax=Pyramimonas orientalis virus TaxID=455367 RepID=A0A7M3UP96_POV01|nr:hypothetical protein HWQ62_00440 [Pyramimonas orientalis virus]
MSSKYITKENYNTFKEKLYGVYEDKNNVEMLLKMFMETFNYDPEQNTYDPEVYHKNKEKCLEKTGGDRSYSEASKRAIKKYNDAHREELNQKRRERYQKQKQLILLKTI